MNERIRELVGRAGGIGHDDDGNELTPALVGKNLEYLAELIVRECIDTISDCSMEYCTRPQIVSEIKEHFGVEE